MSGSVLGIVTAFLFFFLRISEFLAFRPADIKFTEDGNIPALSIIIRESKTGQEKDGVTRTLRATDNTKFPVDDMGILDGLLRTSDDSDVPFSRCHLDANLRCARNGPPCGMGFPSRGLAPMF